MTAIKRHTSLNIKGCLEYFKGKSLAALFDDNGKPVSSDKAKEYLRECLAKGWTILPMCKEEECPDFDYTGGGCPGHPIDKEEVKNENS